MTVTTAELCEMILEEKLEKAKGSACRRMAEGRGLQPTL